MTFDFNQQVIDEFRANRGRVGGPFEGGRLLLLTTTGARGGGPHTVPLGYLPDQAGRVVVIGSAGGSPKQPDWYHNLLADPAATVEDGIFTYQARAVVLDGEERERVFARAVEADPAWADYQERAGRALPVVALEPAGGPPDVGTSAWGDALKLIHDTFRREMAIVRAEVAASSPRLGAQLRVNCLTLCQGLAFHHAMEDGQMLPSLGERYPDLAPTLARIRAEHDAVKRLLDDLQALLAGEEAGGEALLDAVDRLIAEIEAHLDYEERQLVAKLNATIP